MCQDPRSWVTWTTCAVSWSCDLTCVTCVSGSPELGHLDNLRRIVELCRERSVWCHVTGPSLAALLLAAPEQPDITLGEEIHSNIGASEGRKAYLVCKSNARYVFLPLDGQVPRLVWLVYQLSDDWKMYLCRFSDSFPMICPLTCHKESGHEMGCYLVKCYFCGLWFGTSLPNPAICKYMDLYCRYNQH